MRDVLCALDGCDLSGSSQRLIECFGGCHPAGSLQTASTLSRVVGRSVAVLVGAAALASAGLLTLSAVSGRASEIGVLKALGWPGRRIVGQVGGEAVVQGLVGAVLGSGLGTGLAALISWLSPTLSASVGLPGATAGRFPGASEDDALQNAIASVRGVEGLQLSAPVTPGAIAVAAGLALIGGVLAGALGSWRAARLRPALVLSRAT